MNPSDVNIENIDKVKFLVYGLGSFSALSTVLYPLTVIKTNQQAHTVGETTRQTIIKLWRSGGVSSFYNGYGTVLLGMVPARMLYLSSLEVIKSVTLKTGTQAGVSETYLAGGANFVAGGLSSLVTQMVTVPIDVVSQRQMIARSSTRPPSPPHPEAPHSSSSSSPVRSIHTFSRTLRSMSKSYSSATGINGPSAYYIVRQIAKEEGFSGFYRGFGASVATFVPSSAIWWGAYGIYQKIIHHYVHGKGPDAESSINDIVATQAVSAACAGLTSGGFTAPFDMIKTRIQVAKRKDGQGSLTFRRVLMDAVREGGVLGLWSSAGPRMLSGALWGTCSVTIYEALKRVCVKDQGEG